MSGSRATVLGGIRIALAKSGRPRAGAAEIDRRLSAPAANLVPARARLDREARVALFVQEAERVNATTERARTMAEVPARIARYLAQHNLPARLRAAPDPVVRAVPWKEQPTLSVSEGAASGGDAVGVTSAFAGVAETGTLVLLSGPESPTTLNLLPATHIVVLPKARILGAYEETWAALRARANGAMPRVVNWITGPSRTADIEQTLLLGAHGPQRLHIVIVDHDQEGA